MLVPLILAASCAIAPAIEWTSFGDAMESAKRDGKVVFIAINMDGERANDLMVSRHYRDKSIVELTTHTANLFASRFDHGAGKTCARLRGGPPCETHRENDKRVRVDLVKPGGDGSVIAPQHLFVDGDGKILLSVPYQISVGELEWCLMTAIQRLDPEFSWKLSDAARAPKRLVMDGVAVDAGERSPIPPTKDEIAEIIGRQARAGTGQKQDLRKDLSRLLLSEEKRAVDFVRLAMTSKYANKDPKGKYIGKLIREIGRYSPPSWSSVILEFLDERRAPVRAEAAVALEQLGVAKTLSKLHARHRKEEDVIVLRELVRAVAALGPADKKTIALIKKVAAKSKHAELRAAAIVASATLEERGTVLAICEAGLASDDPRSRAAAAWAIAVRHESELRPRLEELALLEPDESAKRAMEAALSIVSGTPSDALDAILADVLTDPIPRRRL